MSDINSSKANLTNHRTTYPAISPSRPELSTKGKSALVTGGGSGIGASIAQSLAKSGITNLALLGRTEKTLLKNKATIEALSPSTKVSTYVADLLNAESTRSAVQSFANSIQGKIDILVPNAGYMSDMTSVAKSNAENWWLGFEINIKGNFNLLQAFQPYAAPHATIIHISSAVVHLPYLEGYSSYRASKLGAYKLFEYYQEENPDFFVLQVHPGLIETGLTEKILTTNNLTDIKEIGLEFDDVSLAGDFVVWSASEEAKFLNGRFVWAAWDVDELKALKSEIEADKSKFTLGLFV
ncbi:hypothetical protein G7046_g959 [Stylonectria norvegica]|nr:hypothetical protein G7046_g959 [Stylonectria norvegica]